jgi:hypothetical protein
LYAFLVSSCVLHAAPICLLCYNQAVVIHES